jgi:hypothetical protein
MSCPAAPHPTPRRTCPNPDDAHRASLPPRRDRAPERRATRPISSKVARLAPAVATLPSPRLTDPSSPRSAPSRMRLARCGVPLVLLRRQSTRPEAKRGTGQRDGPARGRFSTSQTIWPRHRRGDPRRRYYARAEGWSSIARRTAGSGRTPCAARSARGLDSAATPPGCDGCSHYRGFRNRRGPRRDRLGHDGRFCHRRADHANSSHTCWPEGHFSLLRSQLHRPRWRR